MPYTWPPLMGPPPLIEGPLNDGRHGSQFHGLWHVRQVRAWHHAHENCLIETVQEHGGGLYTVPSQTQQDKWYAVRRYPLAPDGYLYVCDCAASEKGGVCCAHGMAVYLWRLRHKLHWRLKRP